MAAQTGQLEIIEGATTFTARMPAARNRWLVVAAVLFGVPWLLAYVALSVVIVMRAGNVWRGLLLVFMLTLLTILIDVLAFASIWASVYTLSGAEVLNADLDTIAVRRSALRIAIPFRAKRGILDRVEPVVEVAAAKNVPHPRLEVKGANARLRFGAGLSDEEAAVLLRALSDFIDRTRGQHASGPEGVEPGV